MSTFRPARAATSNASSWRSFAALGWRTVRFTYEEIAFEPELVADEVRELLSPAAPARRPAPSR